MKKVLFLIVTLVCDVTGAWADSSVVLSGETLTITTTEPGTLSSRSFSDGDKACKTIVLDGQFNESDLQVIQSSKGFNPTKVDMSNARFVTTAAQSENWQLFHTTASGAGTQAIVGGTLY